MRPEVLSIRRHLDVVSRERGRRAADPALGRAVHAVKVYQHERFARTYEDLLAHPRFGPAARFFLDDLYGPADFSTRDEQFARVVPQLVRLFPRKIVATVTTLVELHALTEVLDTRMGANAGRPFDDPATYAAAWRKTGQRDDRLRQVDLMLSIGRALDGYTRNPLLRHSLRAMRQPARLAGLDALQSFLERGFDTFAAMRDAEEFLSIVAQRERQLIDTLFDSPAG